MTRLYQILDNKSQSIIGNIMACKSDAAAIRAFSDTFTPDSVLTKHPEDFDLILLGEQMEEGTLIPLYGTDTPCTVIMQGSVMHQLLNAPKDAQ